jgi:hypothetical protein
MSRDEVLQMARRLAADYGESLTLTAFRRETGISQWAIFDLFGNWKNLRIAVGLTPEAPRGRNRIGESQILELAREYAAKYGERLTERMFLKGTGLSARMIGDRFGSWGELRTAVGLKRRAKMQRGYTETQLLQDLYRTWRPLGTVPRFQQHRRNGGKISASTIQIWFGSWRVAVAAYNAHCRQLEGWHDPLSGKFIPPLTPPDL